jgi:hypothetical protein
MGGNVYPVFELRKPVDTFVYQDIIASHFLIRKDDIMKQ